jgi:hypothetical protein
MIKKEEANEQERDANGKPGDQNHHIPEPIITDLRKGIVEWLSHQV